MIGPVPRRPRPSTFRRRRPPPLLLLPLWGVCLSLRLLVLLPPPCEGTPSKAVFNFGDSLSDPGNNNYLFTVARADAPPNGVDFPGGIATGRFSNGRTTVDILGQFGGLTTFLPPYLAPNATGQAILRGVNYASGAGGILDSSGALAGGRLSMNKQLEYFGNTKAQLLALLGEAAGMELISNAFYLSSMGSNDYLNNYYAPFSPLRNLTSAQVADRLVVEYHRQLTRLYNMGARKIVVASLGPLGCIPSKRLQRGSGSAGCSEELNADSRLFNAAVLAMVKQLNAELPGALFHYQDAYKGVMDIVSDPSRYGFTIVDRGCCVVEGDFFFMTQCLLFFTPCTNRNDYLFWDAFHPSDKANVALSLKFWESTEYMYPMSLKELFFL